MKTTKLKRLAWLFLRKLCDIACRVLCGTIQPAAVLLMAWPDKTSESPKYLFFKMHQ